MEPTLQPTTITPAPTALANKPQSISIIHLGETGKPDLTKYTPEQIEKFKGLANNLDTKDANSIVNFGLELQNKLSGYSDSFLQGVRAFDAGEVGTHITDLLTELNYIDIDPSQQSMLKRLLMSIPFLKDIVMNTKKIFQKYDTVSGNIDAITHKLDQGRITIIRDNNALQQLFDKNKQLILDLEELIVAGYLKKQEDEEKLAYMEANSDQYDPVDIQDQREFIIRLDRRLSDMLMTRYIMVMSLPQIRLVQDNNTAMMEKIQSTVTTTLPIWRNQIAIAVALMRQKNNLEIQEKVYQTTNTILEKNAATLKMNSIAAAKQNERTVVSIETIRKVQKDLLDSINEIKNIKEEGQRNRVAITKELETLEKELDNKMIK